MILRVYEREGLRAEVSEHDGVLRVRLLVNGTEAGGKTCDTLTDAERWARRWLDLDEVEPLTLFEQRP